MKKKDKKEKERLCPSHWIKKDRGQKMENKKIARLKQSTSH